MAERLSVGLGKKLPVEDDEGSDGIQKLDFEDPTNWTPDNAEQAADQLGLVYNEKFRAAYGDFCREVVDEATVNSFLLIIAMRWFEREDCETL